MAEKEQEQLEVKTGQLVLGVVLKSITDTIGDIKYCNFLVITYNRKIYILYLFINNMERNTTTINITQEARDKINDLKRKWKLKTQYEVLIKLLKEVKT